MTAVGPRPAAWLVIVTTATIAVLLRLVLGARGWSWPTSEIADLRVGAIVSATVAGASLGLSGVLLQALLRKRLESGQMADFDVKQLIDMEKARADSAQDQAGLPQ